MPGFIAHVGSTVMCMHGGQAQPITPFPRVMVSGMPVTTLTSMYAVVGCPFIPPAGNGPCVTAQWLVGATRVFAGGAPILVQTSLSICAPTATPLSILMTQTRVAAA